MSVVVVADLRMAFGGQDVLRGVTVELPQGAHVGLVGPNGGGKSTLVRLIAGLEPPTGGAVHRARGDRLVYVAQEPLLEAGRSVFEEALAARPELLAMELELGEAAHALADAVGADAQVAAQSRYGALETAFERAGGYTFEAEAKRVLHGLGLTEAFWPRRAGDLSGGERARLGLARALLQDPDVLLLDEPTNHLDLETLTWLEATLIARRGTLVVVSHDRYFLDRVATTIWELRNGVVEAFRGNYTAYETQRRERDALQAELHERQQAEIARKEEFIRRYKAGQKSKQARGRQKQLDRLERIEAVDRRQTLHLGKQQVARSGRLALRLRRLQVAHPDGSGRAILRSPAELEIESGDRVAIIGANGAGKTTLLRTLIGDDPPLAGEIQLGAAVSPVFFRQAAEDLDPDDSVLEAIMETSRLFIPEARDLAARFLFRGEDAFKRVGDLSGGERSRVSLARLLSQGANMLILDEPTNHLDLPSREALEAALVAFPGTLLFVSHDRRFIDGVATHLWLIEEGAIVPFRGNWSAYQAMKNAPVVAPPSAPATAAPREPARNGRPASREERRLEARVRELERDVTVAEETVERVQAELEAASAAADIERVRRLGAEFQAAEAALETALAAWEGAAQEAAVGTV